MSLKTTGMFVGHGNPMNAIEETNFTREWKKLSKELESQTKPKAILCVSAHWITKGTSITAMEKPKTIHDFGGFPPELFAVQYPAPGHPELANQIAKELSPSERSFPISLDTSWGLDHGTWSVLLHLFPKADVPVIQLSLDSHKTFQEHWEMGERLRFLKEEDVLVIASGNLVHNLSLYNWQNPNTALDWAKRADDQMLEWFTTQDKEKATDTQNFDAEIRTAIASLEHFIPALYMGGFRSEEKFRVFNRAVTSSLSMTSFVLEN